ncbi:hypothetical protein L596_013162 [Steinernema carpocapsae]|uniref:Uncharacterized protein n=1 Tax=Steinernema carpocapsae TaxID=34508 RepID=A0A4U5NZD5_STECR|nr:hypothetical protein L596_013162 [Steinernema carpocapsae]
MLSFYSPYSIILFKNVKEGTEGFHEVKDLKLEEFLQFLGVLWSRNGHQRKFDRTPHGTIRLLLSLKSEALSLKRLQGCTPPSLKGDSQVSRIWRRRALGKGKCWWFT